MEPAVNSDTIALQALRAIINLPDNTTLIQAKAIAAEALNNIEVLYLLKSLPPSSAAEALQECVMPNNDMNHYAGQSQANAVTKKDNGKKVEHRLQTAEAQIAAARAEIAELRSLCQRFLTKEQVQLMLREKNGEVPGPLLKTEANIMRYVDTKDLNAMKQIKNFPKMATAIANILFPEISTNDDLKMTDLDAEKLDALCEFVEAYSDFSTDGKKTCPRSRVRQVISRAISNKKQFRKRKAKGCTKKYRKRSRNGTEENESMNSGYFEMDGDQVVRIKVEPEYSWGENEEEGSWDENDMGGSGDENEVEGSGEDVERSTFQA